ncbi:UNVERIFIED_CONTAM: hypothetical protein HDU68_011432 [Siphonaria sp. JEL0065]|nr:hypothetical protein HDU68_011432 [Siphonaria sp. JEL0065]
MTLSRIQEIGPGCYNLRAPFKVLAGLMDIGTHMSFVKVQSGKLIALSAVSLDEDSKAEVNALTRNGELLEAVIATNPFHTLAFEQLYELFPHVPFYGTPRHIRVYPDIPWAGSSGDNKVLQRWSGELEMRIPDGCEFDAPLPESTNHFSGVVAFHHSSRTDDAFRVTTNPNFIVANVFSRRHNEVSFHFSLFHQALHKTPEAPKQFYDWVIQLTKDWDFENLATAHGGSLIGDAKKELLAGLEKARKSLSDISVTNGGPFIFLGFIDVGTHMTFIKLNSGRFLALSTVTLDAEAKAEVDALTQNGELIDSVVATNPFHTLAFEQFHEYYPKPKFYGTPRHIRLYPDIQWAGSVEDEKVRKLWEPEVDLRLPAGCEFNDPKPETTNHFCGIIALHRASKTLLCDDAFKVESNPGILERLLGARHNRIAFHMSLLGSAIDKTPEAPKQFHDWVLQLVKDWDFENMASAHGGVLVGGAKDALRDCLERNKKDLSNLAVSNGGSAF